MIDIATIAANLERREAGLWCARTGSDVSYPATGHDRARAFEEQSFWFRHRLACILAVMRSWPPSGFVLDVGGGSGSVALAVREAGFDAALLEPGGTGVSDARARGVSPIICSTFEDAGFRDGTIPAAGLFDVLEHVRGDVAFLAAIERALVPGGRLYLTVPAYRGLWSLEDDFGGHYRRYRLSTLRAALDRAGFAVEFATYIFAVMPAPIWLVRTLPSRLGLRREVRLDVEIRQHRRRSGVLGRMLEASLRVELKALERRRALPCGSSCLVVAKARHHAP